MQAKCQSTVERAIAILEEFLVPERRARLRSVIEQRTDALTIVLERTHHPHNISAVIRSADAFGIQTVHFASTALSINKPISAGSERWIDIIHHANASECLAALKADGFQIVVFKPPSNSKAQPEGPIPVTSLPFSKPLALVFGNEKDGVSEEFKGAADLAAFIPMYGFAESFNVSVAVALTLFASTLTHSKQQRERQAMIKDRQQRVLFNWLRKEVRGADQILMRNNITLTS